jgi:peptide/nickel transport system substrate-binding protein
MEQLAYDPDKSKFYLKQAGLDSIDLDLSASNAAFEGAVDAALLYKNSAGEGGININVVQEPADGYWSNVWLKKPWCASYWSGRATEDWMFSTAYEAGAPWNDSQWEQARFQELLLSARAELDSDKRREQYFEMQQILRDDGGVILPMFANYVQALNNRIATPDTVGNLWQMDNGRMAERWSLE